MNGRAAISGKWERVSGVALIRHWLASSFLGLKESGADGGGREGERGLGGNNAAKGRSGRGSDGGRTETEELRKGRSGSVAAPTGGRRANGVIELWLRNGS